MLWLFTTKNLLHLNTKNHHKGHHLPKITKMAFVVNLTKFTTITNRIFNHICTTSRKLRTVKVKKKHRNAQAYGQIWNMDNNRPIPIHSRTGNSIIAFSGSYFNSAICCSLFFLVGSYVRWQLLVKIKRIVAFNMINGLFFLRL